MRNPPRLAVIGRVLAVLAGLGLALQVAMLGLGVTGVTRAWLALDRPVEHAPPVAAAGEAAPDSHRVEPRATVGARRAGQPRAVPEPVPGAVRPGPGRWLATEGFGAETSASSQPPSSAVDPTIDPALGRLLLLDVRAPVPGPSVSVSGLDLAAPRDLVLWQVNEELQRAAPLASTSSRVSGLFELPRLLLPTQAVRLVVTAEGEDPLAAASGAVLDLEALDPPPPRAWIDGSPADAESERTQLRVAPDSVAYALLLGDTTGRELARLEIPAASDPRRAPALLSFEIDERPLRIAREYADGRRSEWSAVATRRLAVPQRPVEKTRQPGQPGQSVNRTVEETP